MYEQAKNSIDKIKSDCDVNCLEYNTIINDCQRLKTKYENRRLQCIDGVNHMLQEYRNINKTIQSAKDKTWSPPEYWNKPIKLDNNDNDGSHLFKDAMTLLKNDQEKTALINEERDIINTSYDTSRNELIDKLEQFNKEQEVNFE